MRKLIISILAVMPLIFIGCEKNEPEEKIYELNVPEFVGYIDKTPEQIKSSIKYELTDETNTLGIVELKYRMKTADASYAVKFKADADGIVRNISLLTTFDKSKSDVINYVKTLTDKVNQTYSDKFYYGNYYDDIYPGRIENRVDFWKYIANNVNKINIIKETWLLKHSEKIGNKLVYLDLECKYDFEYKMFSVDIEKSEYSLSD